MNVDYLGKRVRALSCEDLNPEGRTMRNKAQFKRYESKGFSWYLVEDRDVKTFPKDQKEVSFRGRILVKEVTFKDIN